MRSSRHAHTSHFTKAVRWIYTNWPFALAGIAALGLCIALTLMPGPAGGSSDGTQPSQAPSFSPSSLTMVYAAVQYQWMQDAAFIAAIPPPPAPAPIPSPVPSPTSAPPSASPVAPSASSGEVDTSSAAAWAAGPVPSCIRQHESDDEYGINTGNGYYGAYQFLVSTWESNGGGPGLPSDYPPAAQDQIAYQTFLDDGWQPWVGDGCTPIG